MLHMSKMAAQSYSQSINQQKESVGQLGSENSQIQTLNSRESYKRNFFLSEINTTTYLQTKDLSGELKENKRNK